MQWGRTLSSTGVILLIAFLTILLTSFLLLILSQLGIIMFTGYGWVVNSLNLIFDYLGYSVIFFIPALFGYFFFFLLLRASLCQYQSDPDQIGNIRFYSNGLDLFSTLFFGIGVLFTAWGLQNALISALGGVSKAEAGRMGAWGILKRLVDNGILIALWTTIVGGAGGYLMRVCKFFFLGRQMNRCISESQEQEKRSFLEAVESIKLNVERIEKNMKQIS